MTKKTAQKYLLAIKNSKVRHLTCDALAQEVGIYPEIIAQDLTSFDPIIALDINFDLRTLQPLLESFVEIAPKKVDKVELAKKRELRKYKSVSDFVYKKMTINGLVNSSSELPDEDLGTLKLLIEKQLKHKKKANK